MRLALVAVLSSVLMLASGSASAEGYWQSRPPSPFRLHVGLELGLLLVSVPVWATLYKLGGEVAPPHCGTLDAPCDRDAVFSLDRPYIFRVHGAETAADILFPYVMPVIGAFLFTDYGPKQWKGYLTDMLIVFESVAVTAMITHLVRFTTRRPRPLLYFEPEPGAGPPVQDDSMSFWSGHVSYLMAFGVSAAYIFTLRHGVRSPVPWIMWATALSIGAASATLQVHAGKHFVTDVLVGAAVGSGVGLLVPIMHPRRAEVQVSPILNRDHVGLMLSGRF
jgi:membrane-associated phospholipid phosphatase